MTEQRDRIAIGVELLAAVDAEELSVAEAVDRIETVTTDPHLTRKILSQAEADGVIDREDGVVRPTRTTTVSFEGDVISKDGEFECRRCGTGISTGYFLDLDAGEHGPFGSSCIRKVTGRE